MTIAVLLNTNASLSGSEELEFGLRALRRVLKNSGMVSSWHEFEAPDALPPPLELLSRIEAELVLVVLNPALIVADNLMPELVRVLGMNPRSCVMPADPRLAVGEWQIDYASGAGFERYVARRQSMVDCIPSQQLPTWMYLVGKQQLVHLTSRVPAVTWDTVAELLPDKGVVAQRAFVHSYANYQKSDRLEILDLIPLGVRKLMDVGGGEGGFVKAFGKTRGGDVLLVEPNLQSSAVARMQGIPVVNDVFESLCIDSVGTFDCICFLDVLEHFQNPLRALMHARGLLNRDGHVALSIPNVGHWSVVQDLLQGRFDYMPLGVLCCTHLRFFTEHSLRQLLADAGFSVREWRNQRSPMPTEFAASLAMSDRDLSRWNLDSLTTDSFHVLATQR